MSTHALYSATGPITSDSTATVNTIAERDASGNSTFNTLTASIQIVANGSLKLLNTAKSANFTADTASVAYTCDTTGGSITMTLPAVASSTGLHYMIKKTVAANSLIVDGNASETIDGATTLTATAQYAALHFYCDGTTWWTITRQGTWS